MAKDTFPAAPATTDSAGQKHTPRLLMEEVTRMHFDATHDHMYFKVGGNPFSSQDWQELSTYQAVGLLKGLVAALNAAGGQQ